MGISLEKRSESVGIKLAKKNIREKITLRVGCVLDKSGSARGFYENGSMQELVDRLLAVAHHFDDNGEIDMWLFNNDFREIQAATPKNYGNYVTNVIMDDPKLRDYWGATNYCPVMKNVADSYFPEKKEKGLMGRLFGKSKPVENGDMPAFVLFITDGQNHDPSETKKLIEATKDKPVYWMMVGIGNPREFSFIQAMADKYSHVGMVHFNDLNIDDDTMYDSIISDELTNWITEHKG